MDFTQAAAENSEVLRENIHQTVIDRAPSGDDTVGENFVIIQTKVAGAVCDKGIDFAERAFIQKQVNAFARRQASFFMLLLDAFFPTAQTRLGFEVAQTLSFWII